MKRISMLVAILPMVITSAVVAYEQTHWSMSNMQVGEPPMDAAMAAPEADSTAAHANTDPLAQYASHAACGCGQGCCNDCCEHPAARLWDNFCFWKHHKLFQRSACHECGECCAGDCECSSCDVCQPAASCVESPCCQPQACDCCDTCDTCCESCDACCQKRSIFSSLFRCRCRRCVPVHAYGYYAYGQPCNCPGGYPGCGCVPRECLARHSALGFFHSFDWLADLAWWRETHMLFDPHVRWHCGYGSYAFPYGCHSCGDPHAWINGGDAMPQPAEGGMAPADAPAADDAPAPPPATDATESPAEQSAFRSVLPINFRLFPVSQSR